ncbi:energy-coupling factor ABC transporter ATP-binding protein [Salinarimonas ramus]|uniref:ABC transporter ATP-binding protein n=1 Tax=Salinarimonas ramus TaxID=690164 RepID=A0A917V279_9HYPH|nr:ABC transporter ATP-binding protein [Salinarimonas ramus]GGK21673.1 ABC transporter ATP-binding protein [Salinarimonas ramus]
MHILLENVVVRAQDRPILRGIDCVLTERRIGIVGANGSGKSTFARLLNGLVLPDEGRVVVEGLDTTRDVKAVRREVGFVFQNPDNQIVFPIVVEDVAFGLRNRGHSKSEARERAAAALDAYGLGHLAERAAHTLSGGEKQMVALVSVLVTRPGIVVMDEPTTLLDLRNRNRIRDAVAALEQPAIVVSHDLDLLSDFDRVLVVADGRIAYDDRPEPAIRRYVEAFS